MNGDAKLLYVLADGARARMVEHRSEAHRYTTIDEIDARDGLRQLRRELRGSPQARNQQSGSPGLHHTVGRGGYVDEAKQAFVRQVAERVSMLLRDRGYRGVVLAAPDRLLGPLRERLQEAGAETRGAINRDLTKTPDIALAAWLDTPLAGRA